MTVHGEFAPKRLVERQRRDWIGPASRNKMAIRGACPFLPDTSAENRGLLEANRLFYAVIGSARLFTRAQHGATQ
jgi:hypothetical protein